MNDAETFTHTADLLYGFRVEFTFGARGLTAELLDGGQAFNTLKPGARDKLNAAYRHVRAAVIERAATAAGESTKMRRIER